ncbi:MAG: O-antigen polymerase [Ginsengibacter sp.]
MNDLTYIPIELIFILLQIAVFLFNYQISKKQLFYPPVLFSLVWAVILILYFLFSFTVLKDLYPLSIPTFITFFVGTLCFSAGGILLTAIRQERELSGSTFIANSSSLKIDLKLRLLLIGIIGIGLPIYIHAAFRLFVASQIDNFFVGLRTEINYGDEDIGITRYLISFSFVVFAINYYAFLKEKNKLNGYLVVISVIFALTYSVFATGRTYYFVILSVYLGLGYILKNKFSIKKYVWPILIFITLFMGIGTIYGSIEDSDGSIKGNLSSSTESTAIYLVSSLPAFTAELKNHAQASYPGENTLLFFIKIGRKFGLLTNVKEGNLIAEFVAVPYFTNVYTYYSPYVKDYGKWFAWTMLFLFSMLHTWLYHKAKELKNLRYTVYFSFFLYPLFMSFFMDLYLNIISTWIQIIMEVELVIFFNSFFIKWKKL